MLETALAAAEKLNAEGISAGVVNARILKPLDTNELKKSASRTKLIVTLEDNVVSGGFGQEAAAVLADENVRILNLGWPDTFIEHGTNAQLYEKFGLDADSIKERICDYIEKQT